MDCERFAMSFLYSRNNPSVAMILEGKKSVSEQTVPNFDLLGRAAIATAAGGEQIMAHTTQAIAEHQHGIYGLGRVR